MEISSARVINDQTSIKVDSRYDSSFIQQRNDEYKSPSDVESCFYVGVNYRIAYEHKTKNC